MDITNVSWPGWETVGLIGNGGFGSVYEIRRDVFGREEKAALKVIRIPRNREEIDELYQEGFDEASITAHFRGYLEDVIREYSLMLDMKGHTNVVYCDDLRYVQHDDGIGWDIYIKMELLTPLSKALGKEYSEAETLRIAKDICNALVLCRKENIVHRDIKPQNIFVSRTGDYKLGDFGVAKVSERTASGTKIGTYDYMAPEVYRGQAYGAGADIYSLGLVLYWLMNERRTPFLPLPPQIPTAGQKEAARAQRFGGAPLPPPKHGSRRLHEIMWRACAFDPARRYASADAMLADLMQLERQQPDHTAPTQAEAQTVEEENATVKVASSESCTRQDSAYRMQGTQVIQNPAAQGERQYKTASPESRAPANGAYRMQGAQVIQNPAAQSAPRPEAEPARPAAAQPEKQAPAAPQQPFAAPQKRRRVRRWPFIVGGIVTGLMILGLFVTLISGLKTGWQEKDGARRYYENGKAVTGMQQIDGNTYYFDSDGNMVTGKCIIGGDGYYFHEDGTMAVGTAVALEEGSSYLFGADGKFQQRTMTTYYPATTGSAEEVTFETVNGGTANGYYRILDEMAVNCVYLEYWIEVTEIKEGTPPTEWALRLCMDDGTWELVQTFNVNEQTGQCQVEFSQPVSFYAFSGNGYGASEAWSGSADQYIFEMRCVSYDMGENVRYY